MPIRKIAQIGHPVLRERSRALSREELAAPEMQRFIDDMIETMRDASGAGLAANQVYQPLQICVIEVKDNPRYPYKPNIPLTVLINPELTAMGDDSFLNFEGCLSVPNLRGKVRRHLRLRVRAWDRNGRTDRARGARGYRRHVSARGRSSAWGAVRRSSRGSTDSMHVDRVRALSSRRIR